MFVSAYRYSYDFGVVLGQGKRFSVQTSNRSVRKNSRIKCFVGKTNYPHNRIER